MKSKKINFKLLSTVIILLVILVSFIFIFRNNCQQKRSSISSTELEPLPSLVPSVTPTLMPEKVSIIIGGDVMFDRNIRLVSEEHGYDYPLANLMEFFQSADLVLVNLEGPITDNESVSVGSKPGSRNNFIFTFSPQVLAALKKANINLVNLGNNHILNFGVEGYQDTREYLQQAQIRFLGQIGKQVSEEDQYLSFIWQEKDITVGIVNFNQFSGSEVNPVLEEIGKLRPEVDWLIVYPHWGQEYVREPNQVIKNWARQFVDVSGAHPHVEQINEVYQGKEIYYSLGNLVFDQYFQPEVKQGLVLEIEFTKDSKNINEHRVELTKEGQTLLLK